MIVIIILSTIFSISKNQGTVSPKTSTCGCVNLLNQNDCEAMNCQWNIIDTDTSQDSSPDSTDTSNTNNTNQTSTSVAGICIASTTNNTNISTNTYCGSLYQASQTCYSTLGCAWDPTKQICGVFTGCSAYTQATNALCQAISIKCTSDGTQCIDPLPCQNYTTQTLCSNNIASSGAKSCKWSNSTCIDLTCNDAPTNYTTLTQCQGWILNCLTTGKGCTSSLQPCSSYLVSAGCSGMIGSDGKCTSTTGQTNCRPLNCTDAGAAINTNSACNSFLSGCLTTGKGCAQTIGLCSTYLQAAGCNGLIGSDGPCIADTTSTTNNCRLLQCTDAPTSLITNQGCNNFLNGCVTTGQGCIKTLSTCSSYTGTSSSCVLYVGTDGNCKAGSTSPGSCAAKVCSEAPVSFNTNSACAVYQTGCITTGAGCTNVLGSCSSYTGTTTTCSQYIGIDGSCSSTSINSGPCTAKQCSDAPATLTTSFACQQYSYNCVTNGAGCILPGQCNQITIAISCQGSNQCQTSSVCLNRSSCTNYSTQSQCQLNTQQFQANGTILVRPCIWDSVNSNCQNSVCPTTATMISDSACSSALSGCLTNGAGCIESSADCPSYTGTSTTCSTFRGNFGTSICFSTSTTAGPCSTKTCSSAPAGQTSGLTCSQWLTGCLYNGNGGCVPKSVDCTNYYGTQSYCASIATAVSGGKPQPCYNVISAIATTQCLVKQCSQAVPAGSTQFNTNALCNSFLAGCVTNGATCVQSTSSCATYSGTLNQCQQFTSNSKGCTKTSNFCRPATCANHSPPSSVSTTAAQGFFCQAYIDSSGYNCQGGPTCVSALVSTCPSFISIGSNAIAQQLYCYNIKLPGTAKCGYASGQACTPAACNQFTPVGTTADDKATYCRQFTTNTSGIQYSCGLFISTSQTCSTRTCSDYGVTKSTCSSYTTNCSYSSLGFCYTKQASCNSYTIPSTNNGSELQKAQYCATLISTAASNNQCGYSSAAPTFCASPVAACTSFQWASSIIDNYDKLQWCRASKDQAGNQCAYLGGAATTCAVLGACTTYLPLIQSGQTVTDNLKQLSCVNQIDSNKKACSYNTGGTYCITQQATCAGYNIYGTTIEQNQSICSQLLAGTTKCGYNEIPGLSTVCNNLACSDIASSQSTSKCQAYSSSCTFDGDNCVAIDSCINYTASISGQGQSYNCQQLYDTNNNQCVYETGSNCKSKACSDLTTGQSSTTCSNYLSGCLYNGAICVVLGPCSSYQPSGSSNDLKASICNSLIDNSSAKCAYIAGSSSCTSTLSCASYNVSQFSSVTPMQGCSLLQDTTGAQCGYTLGSSCTIRQCSQALYAQTDSDCNTYMSGCEQDSSTSCSLLACNSAPLTLTTDAACKIYRYGCVTNGAGCLEQTDSCSNYNGTQQQCSLFKSIAADGTITLCYNSDTATSSSQCANKLCTDNTTATSDTDCAIFYPPQTNNTKNCVFNGTLGCISASTTCTQFTGTIDSCSTFTAIDGPCIGTGSTPAPCNPRTCINAPTSYNTDKQCKAWLQSCMTNGFGCITQSSATCSSIQVSSACQQYQKVSGLYCDQAQQCISKMSSCASYSTPSNCNNIPLLGSSSPGCGWSTQSNSCIPINCSLLPVTLVTDSSCSAALSTCTTNKAGCVTKGPCNTYDKQSCGVAATTDVAGKCIWSNSSCRQIQCSDNTSALTDTSCNTYLKGCKTTGKGCASTITCGIITIQSNCLKDSQGQPCLWYNNSCISYTKCQDVIGTTFTACQQISNLCTTNGVNCLAITSCSKTIKQASCIIGTDGQCGWQSTGITSGTCSLFTKCSDASLNTTDYCKLWGSKCISNGTSCIDKANCSTYTNKISCQGGGLDGQCNWTDGQGSSSGSCRVQQCTDAITNITTFEGCQQFSNQCTTNGTGCIQLSLCSSYTTKLGCVTGTDGDCLWATSGNSNDASCRLKQCPDIIKITSSDCKLGSNKLDCVSNGVNCIQKSNCTTYTYKESCLGGGTDGQCAFIPTPNSTTPVGSCLYFKECSIADQDQTACLSRQDSCYWNSTTINGTTTTQCIPHTCSTKAKGSTCQAVPSFDLSTYQLCVLNGTTCGPGVLTSLSSSNCFMSSQQTATWNPSTSTCQQCITQNNSNATSPNNTNTNTTNKYGYILVLTLIFSF